MGFQSRCNLRGGLVVAIIPSIVWLYVTVFPACVRSVSAEAVASLDPPHGVAQNDSSAFLGFLPKPAQALSAESSTAGASSVSTPHAAPAMTEQQESSNRKRGHSYMFAADPIVKEASTLEEYESVLKRADAAEKGLVMMLYSAWCPHCFSYRKTFSRLAMDLRDHFHFAALNCMENEATMDICGNLGISALPSIKLFVPQSLYLRLPASEQHANRDTSSVGGLHSGYSLMHDGGALDSFDPQRSETHAVHSLALPGDDIYLAVQYAARKTQQRIPKDELRLTLEGDFSAFDHLRGVPCSANRWKEEQLLVPDVSPSSSVGPVSQGNQETGNKEGNSSLQVQHFEAPNEFSSRARVHDAVRGLQFVLATWVVTVGEHMNLADQFALMDLLETVRAVMPFQSVKKAASFAIIHLYNSIQGQSVSTPIRRVKAKADESARFSEHLQLYRKLDDSIRTYKGLKTADWRKWIGTVPFGAEAQPLPPLEEPNFKHCTTATCSVWMLMHVLAEGAKQLSLKVNENPKCGPNQLFFLTKGQALPVYLLQQQQRRGRPVNLDEVIDSASLSAEELIERNPSLGCMSIPAFEIAYAMYNFLHRFFGCAACQKHFTLLFSRRSHGLSNLSPPKGDALISFPFPPSAATMMQTQEQTSLPEETESFLLERFRGQLEGSSAAWAQRHVEADKLDELKLWLWRLHNAVSVRTAADATLAHLSGDGSALNYANCDVRWPPRAVCTSCRNASPPDMGLISVPLLVARDADKNVLAMEDVSDDFNKTQILYFLRKSYWPDKAASMKI